MSDPLSRAHTALDELRLTTSSYAAAKKNPSRYPHTIRCEQAILDVIAGLTVVPAPVPVPVPAPLPPGVLFLDEFNGPAGAPPDPTKWVVIPDDSKIGGAFPHKTGNVFQSGDGYLIVRTKREPDGSYSGGLLATFLYGWGWPAPHVLFAVEPPFRMEAVIRMPATPGAWPAFWAEVVNRPKEGPIFEIDGAEPRMTYPTFAGCHQHMWQSGKDTRTWDGGLTLPVSLAQADHVYAVNVYSDHVDYFVDGKPAGSSWGVNGSFGLILDNVIGLPGSWGSGADGGKGGKQPDPNDPGPWDMRVSRVLVTKLS